MSRVAIPIVVLDSTGAPKAGASVTAKKRSDGTNATVYQNETGGTTVANPMSTDSIGRVAGWLDRGAYNLVVTGSGITGFTEPFDAAPAGDATLDSAWPAAGSIDATAIATDAVGAAEIAAGAVGTSELATAALNNFLKLLTTGDKKLAFGSAPLTFGGASKTTSVATVTHGLGATPTLILATCSQAAGGHGVVVNFQSQGSTTFQLVGEVVDATVVGASTIDCFWAAIV